MRARHPVTKLARAALVCLASACAAACAATPPAQAVAAPAPALGPGQAREAALRFDDHLGFGLRLESLSVRVAGRPIYRNADPLHAPIPRELGAVPLLPGVHSVSVLARVSLACGFLAEPRTRVTVRASSNFKTTGGPASVGIDLFARAPIARPTEQPVVAFRGKGVTLGVREGRDASDVVHATCAGLEPVAEATCDVEAFVADARTAKDATAVACYGERLEEMHRMRDVLDDATLQTGSDEATNEVAMHAQLRALYANARIRELAGQARQCGNEDAFAPLEASCPTELWAAGATDERASRESNRE